MWFTLQLLGCLLLTFALAYGRKHGLCVSAYLICIAVNIGFTGWAFPLSYKLAPSFIQPWFLGTATLTLLGFLTSIYYFGETVSLVNYMGAGTIVVGTILLVI